MLAGGRMQVEMTEMPAAGQPTDPPVISNFTNPQFRNSGADFEPEPEPSPDEGSPRGLAPDAECSETLQVIGVDENSPVAWSADASLLAFAARDYGIYIATRTQTGFTVAETLIGSRSSVKKLDFHPSRKLLASGSEEGIKLWVVCVGSEGSHEHSRLTQAIDHDATIKTHDGAVETVLWFLDGEFLATGSKDDKVKIWALNSTGASPEDAELQYMETIDSHKAPVLALAFSPAATCLASCGRDSVIKVWDCTTLTGEARERRRDDSGITCGLINNLEGHRGDVVSIEWSETGVTLVSGARDNTIKIWNPRSGLELRTLAGHKGDVHKLIMLPNDVLWSAAADGTFKLWKLLPEQDLESTASAADADAAAMLDVETMVRAMLEDGNDDAVVLDDSAISKDTLEASVEADTGGIMSAALCGQFLATYVESLNAIRVWNVADIQTPAMIQEFMGHREAVHQVLALSGARIVSAGGDRDINVYDTQTVARIFTMGYGGSVNDLACTPDERLLFAAGTERDIKAYNLTALQGGGVVNAPIALFSGHCAKIFTIDVSADGRWLASAAQDFDMETWSIDAEKLLGRNVDADGPSVESPAQHLEAHASAVAVVAFNSSTDAGGCYLASGGTDHRLAIWNINQRKGSGSEAWSLADAHSHVSALCFAALMIAGRRVPRCVQVISAVVWGKGEASGDMLFSGSWDHVIKAWRVSDGGRAELVRSLEGVSRPAVSDFRPAFTIECVSSACSPNRGHGNDHRRHRTALGILGLELPALAGGGRRDVCMQVQIRSRQLR